MNLRVPKARKVTSFAIEISLRKVYLSKCARAHLILPPPLKTEIGSIANKLGISTETVRNNL